MIKGAFQPWRRPVEDRMSDRVFYDYHKIFLEIRKTTAYLSRMAIEVRLDLMLARRKMKLTELSQRVGISVTNLSLLKTGRVRAIRFSTLDAICKELECQAGDLLEYVAEVV
jgi:putative transcriptional regulator